MTEQTDVPPTEEIAADTSAGMGSEAKAPEQDITAAAQDAPADNAPPAPAAGQLDHLHDQPVSWDKVAELLEAEGAGGEGRVRRVMENVEDFFLNGFAMDHFGLDAELWGLLNNPDHDRSERSTLVRYILARAPTAEVLFNKARELGAYDGRTFADLIPAERASLELAVRIGPAIKGAIDAVVAEADARHPPPKIPLRSQPVAEEDTIFEQVHGAFERM